MNFLLILKSCLFTDFAFFDWRRFAKARCLLYSGLHKKTCNQIYQCYNPKHTPAFSGKISKTISFISSKF